MPTFSHSCDKPELWLARQNQFSRPECRNLYSPEEYRRDIREKDTLDDAIRHGIDQLLEQKLTTGLVVVSGAPQQQRLWEQGNTGGQTAVDEDTVFDLASVTKLILGICYQMLAEQEKVDLSRPLGYYCGKQFENIGHLTLDGLMHFDYTLITSKRLEGCTHEQAVQLLEQTEIASNTPSYSDIPAMILGMAFESIASVSFGQFFQQQIVEPLHLRRTFWKKPQVWDNNYMVYDDEYRFSNDQLHCLHTLPFEVNDRKARSLSNGGELLCGNAGVFSTARDIAIFSAALLQEKIISLDSLYQIGNITHRDPGPKYFGSLCYTKNPRQRDTEIFWGMSGNSFAISGYTGVYYMIDPLNRRFCFVGGNRLHERLTQCDNLEFLGTTLLPYTKNFVYKRDLLRDLLCKYALIYFK